MLNLKSMLKQIKSDVHSDVSTVVFAKSQDIIPLNFDFNFSSINLQKYCVDSDNEDLFIIPGMIFLFSLNCRGNFGGRAGNVSKMA